MVWRAALGSVAAGSVLGASAALTWRVYEVVGSPSAPVGFTLDEEQLRRAEQFLETHPVVDAHAHPGRTFVRGAQNLGLKVRVYALRGTFEHRTLDAMRAGRVGNACFCAVADLPTLDAGPGGLRSTRAFAPGEAYAAYRTQVANLRALVDEGDVELVLTPADVRAPGADGVVGAILGVEGAEFLEHDLERVAEAFADGVRVLTLTHYLRGGVIGDIMTAAPLHGGLTRFGREVVRELNRVGLVVDLSHCSLPTAYDALEEATSPVLVTHTDVRDVRHRSARFVTPDLARAVADAGGVIGAWPAGYAMRTLDDYVERILDLVELLGEDHVCLGTDMDANFRPVFETYAKMPLLVGRLLQRGMPQESLAKVVGGNFLRVFTAALDV